MTFRNLFFTFFYNLGQYCLMHCTRCFVNIRTQNFQSFASIKDNDLKTAISILPNLKMSRIHFFKFMIFFTNKRIFFESDPDLFSVCETEIVVPVAMVQGIISSYRHLVQCRRPSDKLNVDFMIIF